MKLLGNRFGPLLLIVGVMWAVHFVNLLFPWDLNAYGIHPRSLGGLLGILFAPFLHGDFGHLIGNTISLLILGGIVSLRSRRNFVKITLPLILLAGVGVWLLGRNSVHIGASGLVFGYFGYVSTRGFYDRDFVSILVSLAVIILFGGMLWGVLPVNSRISWEGHLFGLIGGFLVARYLKK